MAQSSHPIIRDVSLLWCNNGINVAFGRCPVFHSLVLRTSSRTLNAPAWWSDAASAASLIVVYATVRWWCGERNSVSR